MHVNDETFDDPDDLDPANSESDEDDWSGVLKSSSSDLLLAGSRSSGSSKVSSFTCIQGAVHCTLYACK